MSLANPMASGQTTVNPNDDWRRAGEIAEFLGIRVHTVIRLGHKGVIGSRRLYDGARIDYSFADAQRVAAESVRPRA